MYVCALVCTQKNSLMKKFFVLLVTVLFSLSGYSQESTPTTKTMMWHGTQRQYLEYVPASYDPSTPTPVIFCFHGLGKTMDYIFEVSRFYNIADAHGWILITPQATDARIFGINIGSTWDAGVSATLGLLHADLNDGVDDAGWVLSILDNLITLYNIDQNNVFCTGVSMGGFMSNRMAIEHGDRIKAVASVNGTIGNNLTSSTPVQHVSTMHIHGTADDTISYANAAFPILGSNVSLGLGAEATVSYWRNFNQCSSTSIHTAYPDLVADGKTFEQFLYTGGINHTKTAFIKTTNGHHEWYYTPNNDIDYATEIYNFFASCMETIPTVTTNSISDILSSSAIGGGNITSDGNADIIARGICWSTSQNPTLDSPHTTDSLGLGSFTSILTGLTPNTTYYVRAYATNSEGTAYGQEESFITPCEAINVTISGDTLFCAGDNAILTASGATTYLWNTTATTAEITVTVSGTYTVTGTDVNGCVNTASHTVTVNELPEITISGEDTVLLGESTILSVEINPQWTYLWNTGETTASITVTPEEETTYSVTVTFLPCESTASFTVFVIEEDTVPSDTSGIVLYKTANLRLYPNPTTGIVTICLSPETSSLSPEIQVFDMYGKLVETFHETSLQQTVQINLLHYAPGIYLIKVMNQGISISIGKIVKK